VEKYKGTNMTNLASAVHRVLTRANSHGALRSIMAFLTALWLAGVSLTGLPTHAADADTAKHEVKLNAHVGDRWDFNITQKTSRKTDLTAAGQQRTLEQAVSSRRKGTEEVLAVKDGRPTAVKVTFDKDSTTSVNNVEQPFPLAGKTVTVRQDEVGKVTNDAGELDASTAQEVGRALEPDTSLFPPHPVSGGDEWPADNAALGKEFQLGQGDQVSLKCKLLAIGKVGGRPTADIFAAGTVVKNEQGIITHIDLSGVTQVDLATGETLQSDLMGKIAIKGSRDIPEASGQPVTLQAVGDGTIEVHQTVHPAEELAAGHADNPPHTGSDFPAPAPPAAVPAGHGDAGTFVGTFKDETLTAEFHEAPGLFGGEPVEGTLSLHDKKFPAVAHIQDGKLVGTFEVEGSKFDFTASVDGNVMTLKSGSKTYTLKRNVENPLDPGGGEKPKPKNPLDVQG
jgi:hypothetical protein